MGTPTIVDRVQIDRLTEGRSARSMNVWIALGVIGVLGMVCTGTRIGSVPEPAGQHWWFTIPSGRAPLTSIGFYVSVAVLVVAWLGVGREAFAGRLTTRRAWVILALWGLPFFLGPPLFSRDLYSYIGQGMIAHRGLDPYTVGPDVLGPGPLLSSIASVWRATSSPYGPLFVVSTRGVALLAGSSLVVEVLAFRALELVGVVLIMVSLPRLARHLGTSPGIALWLGALSPLALFGFIASGHNDTLMVGLLLAGVTLWVEGRLLPGLALCAVAATIKLPAAAAVVFLVLDHLASGPPSRRGKEMVVPVGGAIVAFVGVTLACGYGWGWLGPGALHVPTELRVLSTPSVALGTSFFHLLRVVGLPVAQSAVVTVTQAVCEVAAVAAMIWLAATLRRNEVVRSIGLVLILIVVGSPTVWPWYLLWGLVLLAATNAQRSRFLAAVAGLAMLVVGPSGSPRLNGAWYVPVSLAVIAGVVWLVHDGHWRQVVGSRPDPTDRPSRLSASLSDTARLSRAGGTAR